MPSRLKRLMLESFKSRYASAKSLVFVEYSGISAEEAHALRTELRSQGIRFTVVKNSIVARALDELGKGAPLDGPTAIMDGEDPVAVARAAVASRRKNKAIVLKGAHVDGKILGAEEVVALSRLPSRPEMLGSIASAAVGAGARLLSAILAPASRLAGAIETKAEG